MSLALLLAPRIFNSAATGRAFRDGEGGYVRRRVAGNDSVHSYDHEEAELVEKIQNGDAEAMRHVVVSYADRLIRFAYTLVLEHDEAEEIAYEVLSNVWSKRDVLKVDRSLKSYLFASVRFRALDKLAHEQVRERSAPLLLNELEINNEVPTPEDLHFAEENNEIKLAQIVDLRRAIATLPQKHQSVLHLRFEQGLSYPAIGKILSISDKAAQQIAIRSIKNLQKIVRP